MGRKSKCDQLAQQKHDLAKRKQALEFQIFSETNLTPSMYYRVGLPSRFEKAYKDINSQIAENEANLTDCKIQKMKAKK